MQRSGLRKQSRAGETKSSALSKQTSTSRRAISATSMGASTTLHLHVPNPSLDQRRVVTVAILPQTQLVGRLLQRVSVVKVGRQRLMSGCPVCASKWRFLGFTERSLALPIVPSLLPSGVSKSRAHVSCAVLICRFNSAVCVAVVSDTLAWMPCSCVLTVSSNRCRAWYCV